MKGTKRFAVSESTPATNDSSSLWNKRVTIGSAFDVHSSENSQQQSIASPPLDVQRAESSRQHVRALNNLFASWVQVQLKNHPDELWEDGVRDYLAHASNIMEKFSDVVNWLKTNAAKEESKPATDSQISEKKSVAEVKSNNEVKSILGQTGLPPVSTTTSFANPLSSGTFSNNQYSKGIVPNSQSSVMFSNNQSSGAFSNNQNSKGIVPNSQSSGMFSNYQNSGIFSNNQSSGMFSSNQSSGMFSNNQSSGILSSNQSSGMFSSNQSSGMFSSSSSFGLFSTGSSSGVSASSQSSVLFSNNQSSGFSFNSQSSGFFSNSQSPGLISNNKSPGLLFSNNQTPALFANPSSVPATKSDASNDAEDENEEQPSSPSVKKTDEKGIVVAHEVKCKLYVKSSDPADKDPWKDKGTGQLSIRCKEGVSKGTKESKPTIIIRNDVGRILLNALLYPGIKTNTQKNSIIAIFHTAGDGDGNEIVTRTFLIRLKTEDDRNKLVEVIKDYAPSS